MSDEVKKQRKKWKKIVDCVVDKDKGKEPRIVLDSRKKLFMGLFDYYVETHNKNDQ